MVTDHQFRSFNNSQTPTELRLLSSRMFHVISCFVAFVSCPGCQSALIDPGRPRGVARPMQPLQMPAPPNVQQTIPEESIAPGSIAPETSSRDWKNVARQPVTSVIQMSPADDAKAKYHTVLPGETWSSLARQFGLTVKQLADANGIDPTATLQQGQIVYIP